MVLSEENLSFFEFLNQTTLLRNLTRNFLTLFTRSGDRKMREIVLIVSSRPALNLNARGKAKKKEVNKEVDAGERKYLWKKSKSF